MKKKEYNKGEILRSVHLVNIFGKKYVIDSARLWKLSILAIEGLAIISELIFIKYNLLMFLLPTVCVTLGTLCVEVYDHLKSINHNNSGNLLKHFKYASIDDADVLKKCVCDVFEKEGFKLDKSADLTEFSADAVLKSKDDKIVFQLVDRIDNIDNDAMKEMIISMWNFGASKGYFVVEDSDSSNVTSLTCSSNVEIWDKSTILKKIK